MKGALEDSFKACVGVSGGPARLVELTVAQGPLP